jgi:hypothetical protein
MAARSEGAFTDANAELVGQRAQQYGKAEDDAVNESNARKLDFACLCNNFAGELIRSHRLSEVLSDGEGGMFEVWLTFPHSGTRCMYGFRKRGDIPNKRSFVTDDQERCAATRRSRAPAIPASAASNVSSKENVCGEG